MQVYLVGGAVRDKLLNYPYHEHDWVVVGAEPQELLDKGFTQVGKDFPVFLHPQTKEEYALARTERKNGRGYQGFDCYSAPSVTLEEDLQRRDLTINALAEDEQGNIIDPYNGQRDIENKILRHVSDAFAEDPLRVLRTARFFARYYHLGFQIAEQTLALMQELSDSGELAHLSRERIWVETEKALQELSPEQYFICLQQCHALKHLYPCLQPLPCEAFLCLSPSKHPSLSTLQRFGLLFSYLPSQDIGKQLHALKVPKLYSEFAQLLNQQHQAASEASSAEAILTLLKNTDAYRKPERFHAFLSCVACRQPLNTGLLLKALQACQTVNPQSFVDQGITGKAIAKAIDQQRLANIQQLLDEPTYD